MTKVASIGKKVQLGKLALSLKLDARSILNIEKRLGKSAMSLFMSADGQMQLPPSNEILIVLQGANQTHGVSDEAMVDAFQSYLDQGNSPMDLFLMLTELFQESGFFGNKKAAKEVEEVSLDVTPTEPAAEETSL